MTTELTRKERNQTQSVDEFLFADKEQSEDLSFFK